MATALRASVHARQGLPHSTRSFRQDRVDGLIGRISKLRYSPSQSCGPSRLARIHDSLELLHQVIEVDDLDDVP